MPGVSKARKGSVASGCNSIYAQMGVFQNHFYRILKGAFSVSKCTRPAPKPQIPVLFRLGPHPLIVITTGNGN